MRLANPITLALVAAALLATALPTASAQAAHLEPQLAMTLQMETPEGPITAETPVTLNVLLQIDYFTPMALLNPQGFDVALQVTGLPEWASAVVQPAELHFSGPYTPNSHMTRQVQTAQVILMVREDAPANVHEILELTATFAGATGMRPSETTAQTPISAADRESEDACHHDPLASASASSGTSASDEEVSPVTTQSLGATSLGSGALGLALAGGLAGVACGAVAMHVMKRRRA